MNATKITIKNLAKSFITFRGRVDVLKGIDLEIEPGEFFVLLGPSGCGKSTLLNLLAGLEKPSSGELYFDQELVASATGKFSGPFERDISMVFQSYALYPHMTVEENIAFPLTNLPQVPAPEVMSAKVRETAALLQIDHLLDRKPAELSGGQRQRVAIGRAIVRNPKVCLMDEPLSNLDAKLRNEMRAHLKDLQKKLGVTSVYVTHDQLEAMTLGHRIAIMNNGVLQQVGTPVEIYRAPINQFVAKFIGSPTMNMLTGALLEENSALYLQADGLRIKLPEATAASLRAKNLKQITLGVRPERLYVKSEGEQNLTLPVSVIENVGPEFLVYSFHKQGQIVVRTPEEPTGDNLNLALDAEHLHLFDEQGNRISC
ncbi:MAG: ABC transporter ATP-binding protein [Candidatus Riflebacteria bacterium]|nr:ABC transporter ATP-binding protein [Candidatus Riflebacteria bacterium]